MCRKERVSAMGAMEEGRGKMFFVITCSSFFSVTLRASSQKNNIKNNFSMLDLHICSPFLVLGDIFSSARVRPPDYLRRRRH